MAGNGKVKNTLRQLNNGCRDLRVSNGPITNYRYRSYEYVAANMLSVANNLLQGTNLDYVDIL